MTHMLSNVTSQYIQQLIDDGFKVRIANGKKERITQFFLNIFSFAQSIYVESAIACNAHHGILMQIFFSHFACQ